MSGQKVRIPVFVSAETAEGIEAAIAESGMQRQDWFRDVLDSALRQTENGTVSAPEQGEMLRLEAHLGDTKAQLSAMTASNERLETLLAQSQATVNNMTRALPAAGESSAAGENAWWLFWRKEA